MCEDDNGNHSDSIDEETETARVNKEDVSSDKVKDHCKKKKDSDMSGDTGKVVLSVLK